MAERPRDLIGPGHAELGDGMSRATGERRAVERDPPAVSRVVPADHVDQRGLARAVRADQTDDLAPAEAESHASEGLDAAERAPHVLADEYRGGRRSLARRRRSRDRAAVQAGRDGRRTEGVGRRDRRHVARRHRRGRRAAPPPGPAAREDGDHDAVGQQQDDEDQRERHHRATEDRRVAAGEGVERGRDDGGADGGAEPVAGAAQDAHEDDVERHGDRERLAHRDVAHVDGVDPAGHPRDRGRERERRELVAERGHALDLGDVLVVVDGEEPEPEPRACDRIGGRHRQEREARAPGDTSSPSARRRAGAAAPRSGTRPARRRSAC